MARKGSRLLAALLGLAAVAITVACGGGDDPLDVIPTSTTATQISSAPTQPPAGASATPEVSATAQVAGQQEYVVQSGDTLGAIAVEFGVTVDAIMQANSITDPNVIAPGETLVIPAPQ